MILRIEDTDRTRYVKGAEKYILDSLKWCGIQIDEGIGKRGGNQRKGPYRQSRRAERDIYKKYVDELLKDGKAYYAFDTQEELETLRKEYEKQGKAFSYNYNERKKLRNSLTLTDKDIKKLCNKNAPFVIRFKIEPGEPLQIPDEIRGNLTFNTSSLDDKVIFKSDGMPTYHLANVVDDHLMEISHVIRGEEWIPSLPLHILLYRTFGWEPPKFAHLPLILKPQGKGKLSKRDGDKMGFPVFPLEWRSPEGEVYKGYREAGYLPEALINMLALLGWNPGTDHEIFTMDELINNFSLENVGKSGARFDPQKAVWFNHQHLQQLDNDKWVKMFIQELEKKKKPASPDKVNRIIPLIKDRVDFVHQLWSQADFFFEPPASFDEKTIRKRWKGDMPGIISKIIPLLENVSPFQSDLLEKAIKDWLSENRLEPGNVLNILRLLLVGSPRGPHLFDIMEILGRDETIARIQTGLKSLPVPAMG